jgi:hypothetical protein
MFYSLQKFSKFNHSKNIDNFKERLNLRDELISVMDNWNQLWPFVFTELGAIINFQEMVVSKHELGGDSRPDGK